MAAAIDHPASHIPAAGCGDGHRVRLWGPGEGVRSEIRGGPVPREPTRLGRAFHRRPTSAASAAGEPELGMAGDDQPGPPVGGQRVADLRDGPAEGLLESA